MQAALQGQQTVEPSAADSTGFDASHASRSYIHRRDGDKADPDRPKKRVKYRRYGKLLIIVCCATHTILSAVASAGPAPDIHQLDGAMRQRVAQAQIQKMALDAGFNSGHNHRLLRGATWHPELHPAGGGGRQRTHRHCRLIPTGV